MRANMPFARKDRLKGHRRVMEQIGGYEQIRRPPLRSEGDDRHLGDVGNLPSGRVRCTTPMRQRLKEYNRFRSETKQFCHNASVAAG